MIKDKRKKVLITTMVLQLQPSLPSLFNPETVELMRPVANIHGVLSVLPIEPPDIILLDTKGSAAAFHTARIIKIKDPQIKVIVVVLKFTREIVSKMIRIGMDGLLHLPTDRNTLDYNIQAIKAGRLLFTDAIRKLVFDYCYIHQKKMIQDKMEDLNELEKHIFTALVSGKALPLIESELQITREQLETYLILIQSKLGFQHPSELIKYAIQKKIISI